MSEFPGNPAVPRWCSAVPRTFAKDCVFNGWKLQKFLERTQGGQWLPAGVTFSSIAFGGLEDRYASQRLNRWR